MTTLNDLRDACGEDPEVLLYLQREVIDPTVIAVLTITGEPASKARARFARMGNGAVRTYTPAKTAHAEQAIAVAFRQAAPAGYRPESGVGYGIFAKFFCSTWQRRDVDNMLKLVLDGLNGVAWGDDSSVTEVSGRKLMDYKNPRTVVVIYETLAPQPPTRNCLHCGTPFRVYKSQTSKFCQRSCGYEYRKAQRSIACAQCGQMFVAGTDRGRRCCSKACDSAYRTLPVVCVECGKEWRKPRSLVKSGNTYCSPECQAAFSAKRTLGRAAGTCSDCGGPTSKRSYTRCQHCSILHRVAARRAVEGEG